MSKWIQFLLAILLTQTKLAAAAPPLEADPLKGVVIEHSFICVDYGFGVEVYVRRIDQDANVKGFGHIFYGRSPLRWHVGYGAVWVSIDFEGPLPRSPFGIGFARFDLPSLLSRKLVDWPGRSRWLNGGGEFSDTSPAATIRDRSYDITTNQDLLVHYDFLPFGKLQARQFVLTNVPGESYVPEFVPPAGPNDPPRPFKKSQSFPWRLTFHRYEGRWDGKNDERWQQRAWKREGSIKVGFKEPFQALANGDDFYFVTRSGSLFRAPKPAKGKDRVLARVWDGKTQPIKAFVSDAKTGKTFLFVPPAAEGGKRAFFELSDKPKLVEYDPKLVPLPPLAEPHRTILHAARILVALNKIAGKLPAKAGKE